MPYKPWTVAMLAVLTDGDWHPRDQVLAAGMTKVPPGIAYRDGEKERNRLNRRPNGPGPRVKGSDETSIAAGARNIARDAFNNLLAPTHGNPPRLERQVIDGVDCVRLVRLEQQAS